MEPLVMPPLALVADAARFLIQSSVSCWQAPFADWIETQCEQRLRLAVRNAGESASEREHCDDFRGIFTLGADVSVLLQALHWDRRRADDHRITPRWRRLPTALGFGVIRAADADRHARLLLFIGKNPQRSPMGNERENWTLWTYAVDGPPTREPLTLTVLGRNSAGQATDYESMGAAFSGLSEAELSEALKLSTRPRG